MPLHLRVVRDVFSEEFTLSKVYVRYGEAESDPWLDGFFACEDQDRGLTSDMSLDEIKSIKVREETAIPTGVYQLGWHTRPNGDVRLHVLDVPGFRYILLHPGSTEQDTAGCCLPGLTRDLKRGAVGKSRVACAWLEKEARARGLGTFTVERG